jgi:hypothetical protein
MGTSSFSGPVNSAAGFVGDLVGAVKLPAYTVATAPSASAAGAGATIYVSNGAAGAPTVAVSNGTNWIGSNGIAIAIA